MNYFEKYILIKIKLLTMLIVRIRKERSFSFFILNIEKLDWEIESTMESVSIINSDRKNRVGNRSALVSPFGSTATEKLIREWGACIKRSEEFYLSLSEKEKDEFAEVQISFDLYMR